MKPRNSWEQIFEDMQREDERERKALRAYLNRAKVPVPPMSKLWMVAGIAFLVVSFLGMAFILYGP